MANQGQNGNLLSEPMNRKCLLTARGSIQFLAGLNAMEWFSKKKYGSEESDNVLLLYSFGGLENITYSNIKRMANVRQWKEIIFINQEQQSQIVRRRPYRESIKQVKQIIREQYFDDVYLEYDGGGFERIIANAYNQSKMIGYGDGLGMVVDQTSLNEMFGVMTDHSYTLSALNRKLRETASKIIYGVAPSVKIDSYVLALPIDYSGYSPSQIPFSIPPKINLINLIHQCINSMPDFREYCRKLAKSSTKDNDIYLLCNFFDSHMMSEQNEILMYERIIRKYSKEGSSVILKPHPRTSKRFLNSLKNILNKDYNISIISDENYVNLPIELWTDLIESCRLINIFSACSLNIKYLYGKKVLLSLDDHIIDLYFYDHVKKYVKQTCNEFAEIQNAIEQWNSSSYLWKKLN